jgi:hypothetical protein
MDIKLFSKALNPRPFPVAAGAGVLRFLSLLPIDMASDRERPVPNPIFHNFELEDPAIQKGHAGVFAHRFHLLSIKGFRRQNADFPR